MSDAELFRTLYQECYPQVLAYATGQVGRPLGEDVAAEAFAVAWRRRAEVAAIGLPWLLGVARNLIREARRRDLRQYELAVAEGRRISTETQAGDLAGDVVERVAVLRALAALSDQDRELLTLLAWQGLSQPEAARVLGCTTATLAVRLHRARRRLEKVLNAPESAEPAEPGAPRRFVPAEPEAPRRSSRVSAANVPRADAVPAVPAVPASPQAPARAAAPRPQSRRPLTVPEAEGA